MIAVLDVHYVEPGARCACVVAEGWAAATPAASWVVTVPTVAEYEPGSFYKRELPCLLAVLAGHPLPECVVVDGHAWLDERTPGLGAHLYEALGRAVPVVGIAKSSFRGSPAAARIVRPTSKRPLYVTAAGLDQVDVAALVERMHGPGRIPTLVTCADHLCRGIP